MISAHDPSTWNIRGIYIHILQKAPDNLRCMASIRGGEFHDKSPAPDSDILHLQYPSRSLSSKTHTNYSTGQEKGIILQVQSRQAYAPLWTRFPTQPLRKRRKARFLFAQVQGLFWEYSGDILKTPANLALQASKQWFSCWQRRIKVESFSMCICITKLFYALSRGKRL